MEHQCVLIAMIAILFLIRSKFTVSNCATSMSLMPKLLSVALACKALINSSCELASLNIELNLIESLVRVF